MDNSILYKFIETKTSNLIYEYEDTDIEKFFELFNDKELVNKIEFICKRIKIYNDYNGIVIIFKIDSSQYENNTLKINNIIIELLKDLEKGIFPFDIFVKKIQISDEENITYLRILKKDTEEDD